MTEHTLKTIRDTFFKQRLVLDTNLLDSEKHMIQAGTTFPIQGYLQVVDHLRFTLKERSIANCNTWYACVDDIQLLRNGQVLHDLQSSAQKGHGTSELCRRPPIIWDPSPNFSSRNGTPIRRIILHCTTIDLVTSVLNWFHHPESHVSAHYVVARDGKIYHMVRDADKAWHAYGENADSIGIEHVANVHEHLSPPQEQAAITLIKWLMSEYKIPPYAITGHRFSPSHQEDTTCPHHLFGDETEVALRAWVTKNLS